VEFYFAPTNPVPTLGGRNLYLPAGPRDQRPIESRSDVLVFSTSALGADLQVTGKVLAEICISTEISEGSLAARLSDVYPDGRSILIAEGIQRFETMKFESTNLQNVAAHKVVVDLWSTSMVFAKNHHIRLSLAVSNYPRWELPGVTSRDQKADKIESRSIASTRYLIWMGAGHPSRLILPVHLPDAE